MNKFNKDLEFQFKPIKQNFSSRKGGKIKYIVIHDTANYNKGADSLVHFKYFNNAYRGSSAHYFVDDKRVVQIVGDSNSAWHCGDTQGFGRSINGVTNRNSIGIELCVNQDGNYNVAFHNLVELVKNLMAKFNISADRVCRHYDVSRKNCPGSMKHDNWERWKLFKVLIQKPVYLKLDLSKDSKGILMKYEDLKEREIEAKTFEGKYNREFYDYQVRDRLLIMKGRLEDLYITNVFGHNLAQIGAEGTINGPFFDTNIAPASNPNSTCAIAINNCKPLGNNSFINHPSYWNKPPAQRIKRATFLYGDGRATIERINSIDEVNRKIDFAVGGIGLFPSYDPKFEDVPADILRSTYHTAIGFRGKEGYLIVSRLKLSMVEFRAEVIKLGIDGAIALDGGGSSQMYVDGRKGLYQSRKLATAIGFMRRG